MSFYVYLPSNNSPDYYPNNRISNYKVKLPQRLKFNPGEYEVGLVEFTYINSIRTFQKSKDRDINILMLSENGNRYLKDLQYKTIDSLLVDLNDLLKNSSNSVYGTFSYNKLKDRVSFEPQSSAVVVSERLSKILGFDPPILSFNRNVRGNMSPCLDPAMFHIFIYTDIIEHQIVGDSMVPLLRMVNINGEKGTAVTQVFRPYYVPLSRFEFDTIEILLCNEFGEEIIFDKGQSVVTLHFRKKVKNGN